MIPSLQAVVQALAPAFTDPSFATHCQLLLGWLLCPGNHNLYRVGQTIGAEQELCHAERHGRDCYYHFFERSGWTASGLAYRVAILVVTRLKVLGPLYLIVDDTLLHQRGLNVWGLGWFRDAVASTKKRVATASGPNGVVLGLAVPVPFGPERILCLPLLARLRLPGKAQPSCARLARPMLLEVQTWFPGRELILMGDGADACQAALEPLPAGVTFVGRLRGDAALYETQPAKVAKGRRGVDLVGGRQDRGATQPAKVAKGRRGPKPQKGTRLPSPKQAAAKADRQRRGQGPWLWQQVEVTA